MIFPHFCQVKTCLTRREWVPTELNDAHACEKEDVAFQATRTRRSGSRCEDAHACEKEDVAFQATRTRRSGSLCEP